MTNSSKHAFTYREKERFERIGLCVQMKQTNQFIHLPIHPQDKTVLYSLIFSHPAITQASHDIWNEFPCY
jgi:two-component sensor histidine kinase